MLFSELLPHLEERTKKVAVQSLNTRWLCTAFDCSSFVMNPSCPLEWNEPPSSLDSCFESYLLLPGNEPFLPEFIEKSRLFLLYKIIVGTYIKLSFEDEELRLPNGQKGLLAKKTTNDVSKCKVLLFFNTNES